jgi:hypothetical protein
LQQPEIAAVSMRVMSGKGVAASAGTGEELRPSASCGAVTARACFLVDDVEHAVGSVNNKSKDERGD